MDEINTLPESPRERLDLALDYAWTIVKSKFKGGRIQVKKEAPLQHYYAQTLSSLGDLFTTDREEFWIVDLETQEVDLLGEGHRNLIDISCEVKNQEWDEPLRAAIEMKFKDTDKGAPQTSVQCLYDIHTLEKLRQRGYDSCRFLMMSSNKYCWQEPRSSKIRKKFGIYEGRRISAGDEFTAATATAKGVLSNKPVNNQLRFSGDYLFHWEDVGDFKALSVSV